MKIAVAQIASIVGEVERNIELHKEWIMNAADEEADFIAFPELSITGYTTSRASELSASLADPRFNIFQELSDERGISIAAGFPLKTVAGILISAAIFQPLKPRQVYSKQLLDPDEVPYFIPGKKDLIITVKDKSVALGICYESLQHQHAKKAKEMGADVYIASSAKTQSGIEKGYVHYPAIAQEFAIPVLLSNAIGPGDGFVSVGQSAVWDAAGNLYTRLGMHEEGILIFDYSGR